ncbi:AT hook motif-containing protein [Striga asiatica]|uniref:AT hook motif-containing protein n=1 Tax=Striga asiatica TaxID=4170 RepID=A0A5A7NXV1_STRAF|nr:AT hook motif-containing protein [Striga asiatica]
MPAVFDTLRAVNRANRPYLKLRVVFIVEAQFVLEDKNRIEILFQDQEGERISGIIRIANIRMFRDVFKIGEVYVLYNYELEFNNRRSPATYHTWKLVINSTTRVVKYNGIFPSNKLKENNSVNERESAASMKNLSEHVTKFNENDSTNTNKRGATDEGYISRQKTQTNMPEDENSNPSYMTSPVVKGSSFIAQQNNDASKKSSYQYQSVLHCTQNLPLSDVTNVLGMSRSCTPVVQTKYNTIKGYGTSPPSHVSSLIPEQSSSHLGYTSYKYQSVLHSPHIKPLSGVAYGHAIQPNDSLSKNCTQNIVIDLTSDTDDDGGSGVMHNMPLNPTNKNHLPSSSIHVINSDKKRSLPIEFNDVVDLTVNDVVPIPVPKRKRGRPKKIVGSTSTQSDHNVDVVVPLPVPKRKPGRPKKIIESTSTQSVDHTVDAVVPLTVPKRKPGRPKKIVGSTSAQSEYWDMGDASCQCIYCGALFWYVERKSSKKATAHPEYKGCCMNGAIQLPALHNPPAYLNELLHGDSRNSKHFQENIRSYNSMFGFTSLGGKIDAGINNGTGPPVFTLHGQNYHLIGSLLPSEGATPKFAQLYIYDTDNELSNRMNAVRSSDGISDLHEEIVARLTTMLDEHNQLVKSFRMARERIQQHGQVM